MFCGCRDARPRDRVTKVKVNFADAMEGEHIQITDNKVKVGAKLNRFRFALGRKMPSL